jgi:hypothetical protein
MTWRARSAWPYAREAGAGSELTRQLANEDTQSCATLYILMRAVDAFEAKYG